MKSLLTFKQFINEAVVVDDFKKVCITRRENLDDSFITGPAYHTSKYWAVITMDMDPIDYPKSTPVLNYDKETLEKFMEAGAIQEYQVYNHPDARESISSKSEFYKRHVDSEYIIPTVTSAEDVDKLTFPIVAKPDNEHSGLGISVFKDAKEFEDADLSKFTSFSEKISIKEEHRYWLWRGELIQWAQRIPMDEETADIAKKDPKKETNFSYICKDIKKIKSSHIKACRYFSDAHSDLDFYAIDMAETKEGKVYVFEMNSEPGALFGIMTELYKRIYEDFYETELSQETIELLKKFKAEDTAQNTKQNPIWKLEK